MDVKPSLSFYTNIPTPYQLSFFNELAKRFELTVIYYSTTESNREWNFNLEQGYNVILLKNNFIARIVQKKIVDFHFSWQIFSTAWKDKSEYVIVGGAYWIPNASTAMLFSHMRSKKVAYFTEPLFEVTNKIKYGIKWLLLRNLNLCCDAIFCIGKKAAISFEYYDVKAPKFIIPYNIDSTEFANLDELKLSAFKAKYRRGNELILISSGSLIPRKGMDILINAVNQIGKNIKLIIVGDGPERAELETLAGTNNNIIFAGFQLPADLPYFFAVADVFAFASKYDGWAVVINEAIAAGLPIISSDAVGAAIEVVTNYDNGIICASGNVQAFKEAIELLLAQPELREKFKERAKALVPFISSDYNAQRVFDIFTRELIIT
jgi:glycosyltransferase involved in cell wall biosynthesis